MIPMIIYIFVGVHLSYCLSAPPAPGYYPSDQYIFAESLVFDTSTSYNNPTPLPSPMTATATFSRSQADNLYQLALSYHYLDYIIINSHVSFYINYSNPQPSCFNVNVYSANTSNYHLLSFRFLVISSNYNTKFSVSYVTLVINSVTAIYNAIVPLKYFNADSSFSNTGYLIGFNGHFTNTSVSVGFGWNSLTATQVSLYVKSSCNTITMQDFSFIVIRYNSNEPSTKVIEAQYSITLNHVYLNALYNTITTQFGLGQFMANQSLLNFNATLTNGSFKLMSMYSSDSCNFYYIDVISISAYLVCPPPTIYFFSISNTCYDICPIRSYTASTGYQCLSCAYDCYICSSETSCSLCFAGKFPVIGGCCNVSNCAEVITNNIENTTTCISCLDEFILTSTNLCVCPSTTWLITDHCTNVVGCLSTIRTNGTTKCISCKQHYNLRLNLCTCVVGFKAQDGSDACIEICGDGLLFASPCDDGNLIDGDGCSSTCSIQLNYICFKGSPSHPSLCFHEKGYEINVDWIDKTDGQNQGIFNFKISSTFSQAVSSSLISSLLFACNQNITVTEWSLANNQLTVKVNYSQDLQGNSANLSLKLNESYPIQSFLNISFSMKSRGTKLLLDTQNGNTATTSSIWKIIFNLLDCSCLVLFILGSLTHKMIGVQVLTTFQIIFFTSTLSTHYTKPYSLLNYMSISTCNFYYLINGQNNFYSSQSFLWSNFTFSQENLYFSQQVITVALFLCTLAPTTRLIIKCLLNKSSQKNCFEKVELITRVVYNHALFSFAIGFLFINVFAYSSSSYHDYQYSVDRVPMVAMQLFLLVTTAFVFFYELVSFFTIRLPPRIDSKIEGSLEITSSSICHFKGCHKSYIPLYLIYICLMFIIFWVANIYYLSYPLFATSSLTFIFLAWLIWKRPYSKIIHNVASILNLLLILLFSIWTIMRELLSILTVEQNQMYGLYILLGLMIAVLLITVARIIIEFRRRLKQSAKMGKKQNKNMKSSVHQKYRQNPALLGTDLTLSMMEQLNKINPYSLKVQLLRKQLLKNDEFNNQRLLNNLIPLYDGILKRQILNEEKPSLKLTSTS